MKQLLQSLCCLGILASALRSGPVMADVPPGCEVLPIAVHNGTCEVVLPTRCAEEEFYLILGSLSRHTSLQAVTVRTEVTTDATQIPREAHSADHAWRQQIQTLDERLAKARLSRLPGHIYAAIAHPPPRKTFYLFSAEHDFDNPASYVALEADLVAVGRRCQVYVDRAYSTIDELVPTIDDAVRTFDNEVYPFARQRLGEALDVDRDGRFTMLFTSRLSELAGGKVSLSGFVRGTDWYRDLQAPFGNRCDMMYLNTDLKPGAYLHSILAHEYTHAILFSEHVFGAYLPDAPRQDEEAWLNEGLAHLAEDLHHYGWQNLDYRIAAYLREPEHYALVVPDYYSAGLWRSPGHRGAAYLFIRWCSDHYGVDLARKLIQSNLAGVANLEVATGEHFSDLFRQWCVATLLSGTGVDVASISPLLLNLRHSLGSQSLSGPHTTELSLAGAQLQIQFAGTAAAYVLLHSPAGERARISIRAEPQVELQVTLLHFPKHVVAGPETKYDPLAWPGTGGPCSVRTQRACEP